jgi:glutathione S-transferase
MKPLLYAHPFSSYCQKVLIALYENDTPFTYRKLVPEDPSATNELEKLSPLKKFPVLVDDQDVVVESSVIIEFLDIHHAGTTQMIPGDPRKALEVRMLDRFFDNYVMTPCRGAGAVLRGVGASNRIRQCTRLPHTPIGPPVGGARH